ncbi:MAG: diguanylate cyclase [Candidatus Aminicenantes bacterium]|nr:diguanylate cyclase [Candidatus Aminicenantes bacterium]
MQVGYYALSLFAGALVAGAVAAIAWKRAVTSAGRTLAVLMAAVFVWSLAAAVEAAATAEATKVLIAKLEYLGIVSVPVLMFLFAYRFLRSGRKTGWIGAAALWAIPAATVALAFTNERHHLIWSGFSLVSNGRERLLLYDHGTFFWVHAGYSYLLLFVTIVFLLLAYFRFKGLYRRQALALLLAFPPPWIANALYLAGLAKADKGYDLTPIAFALSGMFILWAMFRLQLVDLVPVARERVIDSMGEALFILDEAGRLAATNPAARGLMAEAGGPAETVPESKLLGRPAADLVPGWPELASALGAPDAKEFELALGKNDSARFYNLRLSPLLGQGTLVTGWVAVLYDITRVKRAETEAVEARNIAETLRKAGLTLSSKLDFEQISALILDLLRRVIPYDIGAFMTIEGTELRLAAIKRPKDSLNLIGETFPVTGSRLCNMAVQKKQPLISAISGPDEVLLPLRPDQAIHSFLGAPVVLRERVTGLLALYNSGGRAFTEEDARVAELFASQVAIALDNSRRVELMEKQAVTDELTGLYNRRAFGTMGEREVGRARRYQRPLALILFDIDHFKDVNDSYGHLMGDHVLVVLTRLITKTTRATDIVCRYGGEEFIVLMPEAGLEEGLAMAERLRQEISRMTVVTTEGTLSLTVSLGVAALRREEDENLESLIARADRAMYQAKAAGRNAVRG